MKVLARRFRGWSLIELTIILVVLSILCAILAPVIGRFVRNAKVCRAREDVQSIGCCIWMYIEDTANSYFMKQGGNPANPGAERMPDGGAPIQHWRNKVDLLVSDGDIPEIEDSIAADADDWVLKVLVSYNVDFLENHLVTNNLGTKKYRTPSDLTNGDSDDPMFARTESGGFNSEFAWRGPYMTPPIDPDPWGNRYAVNVEFLDARADSVPGASSQGVCGFTYDTVVLSAGPDEEVDSLFAVDGLVPGDDDILYTISGNSRP